MLTGKLPYEAGDAVSMAIMHVKDPIPRLPPSLRHWQRFIDRALAKGPIKRFHDAAHMLSALERVPQSSGTHEMLALPALREQIAKVRTMPVWAGLGVALVVAADRKSVVEGKRVSVRVDLGGCRSLKKKKK